MLVMVKKVISGGQTGADRGALDAAIALKISHGGWCPRGRKAEDGIIPNLYQLVETPSSRYEKRTYENVKQSDGTLFVLLTDKIDRGTSLTLKYCEQLGKPFFKIVRDQIPVKEEELFKAFSSWVNENNIQVLNVAGNRESKAPGLQKFTSEILTFLLVHA